MTGKNKYTTHVFPMCGYDIGTYPQQQCIMLRPNYLATAFDSTDKPQVDKTFVLSLPIARDLAHKLLELCQQLESGDAAIADEQKN